MMTTERLLLLDGKLDQNFCSVLWESTLEHIVLLEMTPSGFGLEYLIIWYLTGGGDRGANVLHSKTICVPQDSGVLFLEKASLVDSRL